MPELKKFILVSGNGSTYTHVAESIEERGKFFHFLVDGKTVGIHSTYGVENISDQPYDKRY